MFYLQYANISEAVQYIRFSQSKCLRQNCECLLKKKKKKIKMMMSDYDYDVMNMLILAHKYTSTSRLNLRNITPTLKSGYDSDTIL